MGSKYLFTSSRLGFRAWQNTDIPLMAVINADPVVMEFFPGTKSLSETIAFVEKMQYWLVEKGYCYYAVDTLANGCFIGFIGISEQTFGASFTPCIDIGWRLHKDVWGRGYATEGAQRCLEYGFLVLGFHKITAIAPKVNLASLRVMEKAGMKKILEFTHPLLTNETRLKDCFLYEKVRP